MAKNAPRGDGRRTGAVKNRTQVKTRVVIGPSADRTDGSWT
jgi:hypothetical protein